MSEEAREQDAAEEARRNAEMWEVYPDAPAPKSQRRHASGATAVLSGTGDERTARFTVTRRAGAERGSCATAMPPPAWSSITGATHAEGRRAREPARRRAPPTPTAAPARRSRPTGTTRDRRPTTGRTTMNADYRLQTVYRGAPPTPGRSFGSDLARRVDTLARGDSRSSRPARSVPHQSWPRGPPSFDGGGSHG